MRVISVQLPCVAQVAQDQVALLGRGAIVSIQDAGWPLVNHVSKVADVTLKQSLSYLVVSGAQDVELRQQSVFCLSVDLTPQVVRAVEVLSCAHQPSQGPWI